MKPLVQEDLIPYAEYELRREEFRRQIIDLKRRRRISLGDLMTLVFENRDTVQFQIQEMIRVERIVDPAKVRDELDVYNELLPQEGGLSATLMIEITDNQRVKEQLDTFLGIDHGHKVAITAGPSTIYGEFEGGHSKEEKLSAVHFVKFHTNADFVEALTSGSAPVTLRVSHGSYQVEVPVSDALRREWLADLQPETFSKSGSGTARDTR